MISDLRLSLLSQLSDFLEDHPVVTRDAMEKTWGTCDLNVIDRKATMPQLNDITRIIRALVANETMEGRR